MSQSLSATTEAVESQGDRCHPAYQDGPLVPLTLRVGVTGHRPYKLELSDRPLLLKQIETALNDLYACAAQLCASAEARWMYRDSDAGPQLTVISSLAEGADRLVVDKQLLNLAFDFELVAPLPFDTEEYSKDFKPENSQTDPSRGSVDEFRALLQMAAPDSPSSSVVQLDGAREEGGGAYLRSGTFIVRHSDVVITVWDDQEAEQKTGGTADVIDLALRYGILVICVSAKPPYDLTIRSEKDQSPKIRSKNARPYSKEAVRSYLELQLLYTDALRGTEKQDRKVRSTIHKRLRDFIQEKGVVVDPKTVPDFRDRGPLRLERYYPVIWGRMFRLVRNCLAPDKAVESRIKSWGVHIPSAKAPVPPAPLPQTLPPEMVPSINRFFSAFLRADQLAVYYSDLHRSVFMTVYILGALALSAAASALYFEHLVVLFAVLELFLLVAISALVFMDHRRRYHERWIDYRTLAELLRPMIYLAMVGWTVPLTLVRDRAEEIGRERLGHAGPARSWVFMHFETIVRHAGVLGVKLEPEYLKACRSYISEVWLSHQIAYHVRNAARSHLFGRRLFWISLVLFMATVAIVILKLIVHEVQDESWLHAIPAGLLAAIFPAVASAAYAIRSHAEFDILSQRSQTMRIRLTRRRNTLDTTPLHSDRIGEELCKSAELMFQETADWAEIFEVKEVEPA